MRMAHDCADCYVCAGGLVAQDKDRKWTVVDVEPGSHQCAMHAQAVFQFAKDVLHMVSHLPAEGSKLA